jgi:hypothetical protein
MKLDHKRGFAIGVGAVLSMMVPFIGFAQGQSTSSPGVNDITPLPLPGVQMRTNMPFDKKPGAVRDMRQGIRDGAREERKDAREDIRDMRQGFREGMKIMRASTTIEIETRRKELHELMINATPEERRKTMEEFRKEVRIERKEMQKEIKDQREAFRKEAKTRMEEMKKKVGESRAMRIEESFGKMIQHMEEAIDRLNSLADRIGNRLDILVTSGKDVSSQQTALIAARKKITDAETAIATAKSAYEAMTASTNPKDAFPKVQTAVKSAQSAIKNAHAALVGVIESIKKGRLENVNVSGGATASTTTNQ